MEAWNQIKQLNLSSYIKQIQTTQQTNKNIFQKFLSFCTTNKLSRPNLMTERDQIFAFAKVQFDDKNAFHFRMLYTIFTTLKNTDRCLRYGQHWELIGF